MMESKYSDSVQDLCLIHRSPERFWMEYLPYLYGIQQVEEMMHVEQEMSTGQSNDDLKF